MDAKSIGSKSEPSVGLRYSQDLRFSEKINVPVNE